MFGFKIGWLLVGGAPCVEIRQAELVLIVINGTHVHTLGKSTNLF